MRLLKYEIIYSTIASVASFLLYVSDLQPVLLTVDQANEMLLAIFGAGISTFFAALMEYQHRKRELEDDLLKMVEPLISAVAGIKNVPIELIAPGFDSVNMLTAYFEEDESNAMWSGGVVPMSHGARDALISAIEGCDAEECERYLSDPHSHSSRYIERAKRNLKKQAENYGACDKTFREMDSLVDGELKKIAYLTAQFKLGQSGCCFTANKKSQCLLEFIENKAKVKKELEPAFKQVRSFNSEQASYAQLLSTFVATERASRGQSRSAGAADIGEALAMDLFAPLSRFASMTKSPAAGHYETSWW